MKGFIFLVFSAFFVFGTLNAQQDLSNYSYVLVPQQFEFQKEKDQYRFNTLMRHLFNSSGFNAIYAEEHQGLPRCEGLYADLISESNFTSIKTTVVLKDCNDQIVYRSPEGRSKSKNYQEGYHEALRQSFDNIAALRVQQKDLGELRKSPVVLLEIKEPTVVKNDKEDLEQPEKPSTGDYGSKYSFQGETYYLKYAGSELVLYRKASVNDKLVEEVGKLRPSSKDGIYIFNANGKSALATFDADKNLYIDSLDSEGNLAQQVFMFQE